MPGPSVPYREIVRAQGVASEAAFEDGDDLRRLRQMVDAVDGVTWNRAAKRYEIDPRLFEAVHPSYRPLIESAVARAGCDPLVIDAHTEVVRAQSGEDLGKKVEEALKALNETAEVVQRVRTLIDGTIATKATWWGVQVDLKQDAASALAELVSKDLNMMLAAVSAYSPHVAPILAVTLPAGFLLKGWIEKANGPAGVRLELMFWILPYVSALPPGSPASV